MSKSPRPGALAASVISGGINRRCYEAQAPRAGCCGYVPTSDVAPASVEYHVAHKAHHLASIPSTTPETIGSLDTLILQAGRAASWGAW